MNPKELPSTPLLHLDHIHKTFSVKAGVLTRKVVSAVDDVTMTIRAGSTVGVVGESGCGKSTLARVVTGLARPDSGTMSFHGEPVPPKRRADEVTRNIQMVFQDPYSALNPRASVGDSIMTPLRIQGWSKKKASDRVAGLLEEVGLHRNHQSYYSHQMSGGQRQRVNIARALALNPELVVCDEAVSALDKSVQAQILNLLRELQDRHGMAYMFISHDLNVVEYMSDEVVVMYLGRVVETCSSADLYRRPLHPYTQALLASSPRLEKAGEPEHPPLEGEIPSAIDPPSGCRFRTRCPHAMERCAVEAPSLSIVEDDHQVACHLFPAAGPMGTSAGMETSASNA